MFGPEMRGFTTLFLLLGLVACHRPSNDDPPAATAPISAGSGEVAILTEQVKPPFELKTPPADATKTASGLVYKKLVTNDAGTPIKRNDTVLINYTGWSQNTGKTFYTNRATKQPLPLNLTQAAAGFTEAMQLLRKGETAVLWMPAAIGYKTPPTDGTAEPRVYQVEVADVTPAPPIPDDVAKPPANAAALPSGTKFVVIREGTGTDKARQFDNVTYTYIVWDGEGRMIDADHQKPRTEPPYKQSVGLWEMLTSMTAGERARFWVDAEKMVLSGVKPLPVQHGQVCLEIDVSQVAKPDHEPPPTPPDVAKPPDGVKKTAKGVFYRVIKPGPGKDARHPEAKDTVKVNYTGWTTDGRMFDSSELRGDPATFSLGGVIAGWTDGIPVMTIGDRVRFWIPEDLAYKGVPGKPAGMLVFEVELLEIMASTNH
jgi:FKBP-type peptidyl-prolyl cis-trans isomerase